MADHREHPAPPAGEQIHMPGPSLVPLINAFGVALLLVSLATVRLLLIPAAIIIVVTTVIWIRDVRRDIEHLPASHH